VVDVLHEIDRRTHLATGRTAVMRLVKSGTMPVVALGAVFCVGLPVQARVGDRLIISGRA
jgi:hypothetical protein